MCVCAFVMSYLCISKVVYVCAFVMSYLCLSKVVCVCAFVISYLCLSKVVRQAMYRYVTACALLIKGTRKLCACVLLRWAICA